MLIGGPESSQAGKGSQEVNGGFLDRARAARLMEEQRLDALLLLQPETVRYASGSDPGVAAFWRRAGAAMVLVPADPSAPMAAVVGDLQAADFQRLSCIPEVRTHPIWVDTADIREADLGGSIRAAIARAHPVQERPATFDRNAAFAQMGAILADRGFHNAGIGTEHAFLPVADAAALATACPGVAWFDASELVARLRMIKHPVEREWLRLAARAAEVGLRAIVDRLGAGVEAAMLSEAFERAALAEARRIGAPAPIETWSYISIGRDGFAPGGPARPGDIIKADVGCVVRGYSSDSARTLVLGEPESAASEVHSALLSAFETGCRELRPGRTLGDIFRVTRQAMHESGFTTYSRGHFGHSVGASIWSEEWPFVAADSQVIIEPGMVLAFEVPWYIRGLGGFIIEDQFTVFDNHAEAAWSFPRTLSSVMC
jgi:Xaa-Pro dipeptidase